MDDNKQSVRTMSEDELSDVINSVLTADHQHNRWRVVEYMVLALFGGAVVLIGAALL